MPSLFCNKKVTKVMLVTAHPDDEVMFFTPLLTNLQSSGHQVSILCLSDGNYEGLGSIRSNELIKCAAMFQINSKDVHIVNHPSLQDGMNNNWPTKEIAEIVQQYIRSIDPHLVRNILLPTKDKNLNANCEFLFVLSSLQVVTFDERGVSDHPNHIATFHGVKIALSLLSKQKEILNVPLGLKLKSNPICRKFCGILDLLIEFWFAEYLVISFGLYTALKGMYIHRSQNQFYRQVFVLMSTFTYINSFTPIL